MNKLNKNIFLSLFALLLSASSVQAQVEVSTGADFYSTYVFRGIAYDGPSLQPSVTVTSGGFSVGAWGSQGFSNNSSELDSDSVEIYSTFQEMDLYMGYEFSNGLYLGLTDYYYPGSAYGKMDSHALELNASYTTDAFSIAANYIFNEAADAGSAGSDMYFELGYSLDQADVFVGAGDGWHSNSGDFALVNIGISTDKEIEVTDTFSIPVSGSAIWNPDTEQFYILVGFSF
jgi:hypothetical protein